MVKSVLTDDRGMVRGKGVLEVPKMSLIFLVSGASCTDKLAMLEEKLFGRSRS